MKSLFACLLLGVSVALAVKGPSEAAASEMAEVTDRNRDPLSLTCCFNFVTRRVPLRHLKSFSYTNERCSLSAVVFLTKRGRKFCADPSEQWVQDHIRNLSPS